jgi:hypothetical protein
MTTPAHSLPADVSTSEAVTPATADGRHKSTSYLQCGCVVIYAPSEMCWYVSN